MVKSFCSHVVLLNYGLLVYDSRLPLSPGLTSIILVHTYFHLFFRLLDKEAGKFRNVKRVWGLVLLKENNWESLPRDTDRLSKIKTSNIWLNFHTNPKYLLKRLSENVSFWVILWIRFSVIYEWKLVGRNFTDSHEVSTCKFSLERQSASSEERNITRLLQNYPEFSENLTF